MKITVYSREGCAPCKTLKHFLDKKEIKYEAKDVNEADAAAEAYAYSGASTVPVTVVESEGSQRVVTGLNLSALMPLIS